MDNVTHTMLGVAMARAGLAQRFGKGTTLVLAVASNLPDIDALWVLAGQGDSHLSRRLLTHSVPGLLLLAVASATVFRWFYQHLAWKTLFGLSLLAMTVHVFFDLVNSYGVVLFYPFNRTRFEFAWVFIIDLAILGLLLAPAGLGPLLKRRVQPASLWRASLVGVALYVAVCAGARAQAERVLRNLVTAEQATPELTYVFPEPLGPRLFRGVIKEPGGGYKVYLIRVLSGAAELQAEFPTDEQHPVVRQARASDKGQRLEWFFKAPVWELLDSPGHTHELAAPTDEHLCVAYDLRFFSLVLDRGVPFRYQFLIRNGMAKPLGWE